MNLFKKNLNPYWAATTGLAAWFLVWHTPPFWKHRQVMTRDTVLAIHLVAAGTIYGACAHNCLVTPSLHPVAKQLHTWIGRLGLVSGVVAFGLGAFLAWSRLVVGGDAQEVVEGSTTLGFAIPITIGGILQIISEVKGFRAIRQFKNLRLQLQQDKRMQQPKLDSDERKSVKEKQHKALTEHISAMLTLFVLACSIPAGIRLAFVIAGREDGIFPTVMIVLVIVILQSIATRYVQKMSPPLPNEQEVVPIHPPRETNYNSISN